MFNPYPMRLINVLNAILSDDVETLKNSQLLFRGAMTCAQMGTFCKVSHFCQCVVARSCGLDILMVNAP